MTWKRLKTKWKWNENENENEIKRNEMKMKWNENEVKLKWNWKGRKRNKTKRNEMNERANSRNEWNDLKWTNWIEWIATNELTWMKWHEWMIEWTEMNDLNWMTWNEWLDMHELKWMNWNEWTEMNDLKWMNWSEWIEMNELNWMNWNEWVDMNELKWMNWNELNDLPKVVQNPHFFRFYVKSSSRNSLVHLLLTSSFKSVPAPSVFCDFCDQLLHDDVVDIWNQALATVSCTFCRPHLPKVLRATQFFNDFYVKSSSRNSLVHLLLTLSFKSAPTPQLFALCDQLLDDDVVDIWSQALATFCRPHLPKVLRSPQFFNDFYVTSSSRNSLVRLLPTSSSKSALAPSICLTIFMWNRALATVLCTFCRPLSPIEPRNCGNRGLLRRPRQTLYPKKYRVSCPRVFSSLNSRVPDRSHFRTTCMMLWLPWWLRWWCGCHYRNWTCSKKHGLVSGTRRGWLFHLGQLFHLSLPAPKPA